MTIATNRAAVFAARHLCKGAPFRAWLKRAHPEALLAAARRIDGPSELELCELSLAHLCGVADVTYLSSLEQLNAAVAPWYSAAEAN